MKLKDLSPEQQAAVKACQSPEELYALAKEYGHELTDDELEAIAGGWDEDDRHCHEYRSDYGCTGVTCYTLECDAFTCQNFADKGESFYCPSFSV